MRVLEDVSGGEVITRQGWVPAKVLKDTSASEEKGRDLHALAARRQ